jgi:hypothetical protein
MHVAETKRKGKEAPVPLNDLSTTLDHFILKFKKNNNI